MALLSYSWFGLLSADRASTFVQRMGICKSIVLSSRLFMFGFASELRHIAQCNLVRLKVIANLVVMRASKHEF